MGGAWGLFRADSSQRMTFQGPVREDRLWWRGPLAALLTGLATLVLHLSRPHRATSFGWVLALALAGAVAPAHFDAMALWSRDRDEWGIAIAATVLVTTGAFALLWNLFEQQERRIVLSKFLSFALLVTSSVWALYLWVDPRYRGFPIALFYCPAVYSLCLMIERGTISRYRTGLKQPTMTMPSLSWTSLHTLAVGAIAICLAYFSFKIMMAEGIKNTQALIMGLLWILIALGQIVACYPRHPVKA